MENFPSGWSIISAIITVVGGLYPVAKRFFDRRADTDEKVFWNVVNPAYSIIEPFLFCEISEFQYSRILRQLSALGEAKKPYSYAVLLPIAEIYIRNLSERKEEGEERKTLINADFRSLCSYINGQYDLYLKKLRLPRRSNRYLLLHKMHRNKRERFILIVKEKTQIVFIVLLAVFCVVFLILYVALLFDTIYNLLK